MQIGVQAGAGDPFVHLELVSGLHGRRTLFEEACHRLIVDKNLSGKLEERIFGSSELSIMLTESYSVAYVSKLSMNFSSSHTPTRDGRVSSSSRPGVVSIPRP